MHDSDQHSRIMTTRVKLQRHLKTLERSLNVFACSYLGHTHLQPQVRVIPSLFYSQLRYRVVIILLRSKPRILSKVTKVKNVDIGITVFKPGGKNLGLDSFVNSSGKEDLRVATKESTIAMLRV